MSVNWDAVEKLSKQHELKGMWFIYGLPEVQILKPTKFGPTIGVDVAPKWDIPDKVAISTAIVGAMLSTKQNPCQPVNPEETYKSALEVAKAGSPSVHLHVREEGYNVLSPKLFHQVVDPIRKECPDTVIDACMVPFTQQQWDDMVKIVEERLFEVTPINTTTTFVGDGIFTIPPHLMIKQTKLLQDHGLKPQIAIYTDADVDTANRYLVKTKLLEKPYFWIILPAMPGFSPMPNPKAMVEGLMHILNRIHEIDRESVVMVCAAGRASSYLGTLAMLLGLHVRCGMEDTIYEWPHKNDEIKSNLENYLKFKNIAELLGRKVATPNEYRKFIGLK